MLRKWAPLWAAWGAIAQGAGRPEVRVEGQEAFGARRIESYLAVPERPEAWTQADWESWAEDAAVLLTEAYRDQGYFDARAEVRPPASDSGADAFVAVRVFEGPRYAFGSAVLRLPPGPYPVYPVENLRSRPGRSFHKEMLFRDRRDLLRFYGNGGFLKAQAAESLFYDTAGKVVHVAFRVQPGNALVFDTLVLRLQREGDTTGAPGKSSVSMLRGLFKLRRGDTLTLKEISAYERKLKSTRIYNYVRIRDSLDASGRSALVLSAEEKIPGEIDLSAFWENLYGFGTSLGWSHGNVAGSLQEFRGELTFAQRRQSALLGYASPLLFGTSVRFDNDFQVNWRQDGRLVRDSGWFRGDFDVTNLSRLSRQLLRWMRYVGGAELLGKSEKLDTLNRLRDFHLNYLNSLFLHDLDDVVNPSRGGKVSLTWGNGGPLVRQEAVSLLSGRHNWLEAGSAAYLPAAGWLVLALRLDGGRFFGEGGINSERFFLGGGRSVRNADWRRVCPDTLAGGCRKEGVEPAYFLASAEARIQPFQPSWIASEGRWRHLLGLQIVPFADYGNVWQVGQSLTESGRGRALGLGARYVFLALFNVRVDYAWDPRDPGDESRRRWIFDLIQAF